jgi:hypothetical protein
MFLIMPDQSYNLFIVFMKVQQFAIHTSEFMIVQGISEAYRHFFMADKNQYEREKKTLSKMPQVVAESYR